MLLLQGVGKSTVANLLANRIKEGPPPEGPFQIQTLERLIEGYPQTTAGVDMYITQDRLILLDTQPLLDWALTDLYIQGDLQGQHRKHEQGENEEYEHQEIPEASGSSSAPKKWSVEGYAEITSLQVFYVYGLLVYFPK